MTPFACRQAARLLYQGAVVGYPTEAVYGLGCDPFNVNAVQRLLQIKQRPMAKGLILVAAEFEQLRPFVAELDQAQLQPALDSWPGPFTWLLPARDTTPYWLTGKHRSIAVRVSAHPLVRQLCLAADMPLVSTSANRSRQQPARTAIQCRIRCPEADLVLPGSVNRQARPSQIRDLLSGATIRS